MFLRKLAVALCLTLAAGTLGAVPANAACAGATPRISLTGFTVPEGPRRFYLGVEGQSTIFTVRFAGGCSNMVEVDWATGGGSATPDGDYIPEQGSFQEFILNDESKEKTGDVFINGGDGPDGPVESVDVSLSNPRVVSGGGSVTLFNSSAPILIVDADGTSRVGFEGVPYSQSETFATARIPVFRAGPSGEVTVNYSIASDPSAPAMPGDDYSAPASGTLTFSGNERMKTIDIGIVNDDLGEGPESVILTLDSASAGTTIENGQMTFTILDNEEFEPPSSRLHHPRHKWRYKKSDFRIREVHVFTSDNPGGSGVVGAQFALKRTKNNGSCQWLTKSGWQAKDCQNRQWVDMKYEEGAKLFYLRLKQLKSSVKTKIKNYTAFSRAIDGAGNTEKDFGNKRNDNTFEVKRTKKKRRR